MGERLNKKHLWQGREEHVEQSQPTILLCSSVKNQTHDPRHELRMHSTERQCYNNTHASDPCNLNKNYGLSIN